MQIAVVIPTLNEAQHLPATLASLRETPPQLVVVADCDSADDTAGIAQRSGATVLTGLGLSSRAEALQAGVQRVFEDRPDIELIWMLHGDSVAPPGWHPAILDVMAEPGVVGGAFAQRFGLRSLAPTWAQRRLLRFVIFCNRCRYRITGVYFGDQGIFARASALREAGGIPQVPLMEDVELCRRLQKLGKLKASPVALTTSPRRFLKHGVFRQMLTDWGLLLGHRLGIKPAPLYAHYNADNHAAASPPAAP